jgi:hypothetical protein
MKRGAVAGTATAANIARRCYPKAIARCETVPTIFMTMRTSFVPAGEMTGTGRLGRQVGRAGLGACDTTPDFGRKGHSINGPPQT